jgi:hypothetical protein
MASVWGAGRFVCKGLGIIEPPEVANRVDEMTVMFSDAMGYEYA